MTVWPYILNYLNIFNYLSFQDIAYCLPVGLAFYFSKAESVVRFTIDNVITAGDFSNRYVLLSTLLTAKCYMKKKKQYVYTLWTDNKIR